MGVRFLTCAVIGVFLVTASPNLLKSQDSAPTAPPQQEHFTGTVTQLGDTSITVTRTVLGKVSAVRTFSISSQTQIEGKLKMKSRVTITCVADGDDDEKPAMRIKVRDAVPPPKKP